MMDFDMIRFSDFLVKKRRELKKNSETGCNVQSSSINLMLLDDIIFEFKQCLIPLDGDDDE